jgi:hypothetical protein
MGKNFIKIGRKSKRELNPVERYNRKLKEKKKLRGLIHKLNKRQDEPFIPRKRQASPEPEPSNDPMLQQLITARSLRKREEEPELVPEEIVEVVAPKQPTVLMPTSLVFRPVQMEVSEDSSSEGELPCRMQYDLSVPKPRAKPSQDFFKKLINQDDKLKAFYDRISRLG